MKCSIFPLIAIQDIDMFLDSTGSELNLLQIKYIMQQWTAQPWLAGHLVNYKPQGNF